MQLLNFNYTTSVRHKEKILSGPRTASVAYCRGFWMMQIDTWPWSHTSWGHIVLIGPQVCKWVQFYIFRLSYKMTSHHLWPSFVIFDLMNMWRFLHYINKPSLVHVLIYPSTSLIFMSIICTWFAYVCFWIKLTHSSFQRYMTCFDSQLS